MEKEIKLNASNFRYRTEDVDIYRVGKSKIHLFSTLEDFITEETCFKLSKVETTRILLPKPFYQNGEYIGCITKWKERDWIHAFYESGTLLRKNLIAMKEELESLSELGIDIGAMPFYCSYYDRNVLSFDGTLKLKESNLSKEDLKKKNQLAYQEYIRSLVYNGMSEFVADGNAVEEYLYSRQEDPVKRLEKALHGRGSAGYLIHEDVVKHRNK